ncbi:MAG: RNA polymerase sigma factor [Zavarzinella sp.]
MENAKNPMEFVGDGKLIELAITGDRPALNHIFQKYRDDAYRVAYRLLGNKEDALDAIQEGFTKVFLKLETFEFRSSLKTWILRIVTNSALDYGRKRQRAKTLVERAGSEEFQESPPRMVEDPANVAEYSEMRSSLNGALMQLPEAQRSAFTLHVDGGLSYAEIAEVLEISIGTVMSRLFYARQKLKGLLSWQVES